MPDHIPDTELTVDGLAKQNYLRVEQRRDLEQTIRSAEERLANPVVIELTGGDPDALRKQVARETEMLNAGTPPRLNSTQENKIRLLEDHLRKEITHSMPTFTMMERGRPTDIDHHVAWEREHKRRVLAWKNCLLILDPNNTEPNFLSIARLRSDTVKGDPRKYVQNFDNIKWQEVIEENLIRDMDDNAYHTFLELKLVGWSKPSICKELSWTPKMYEAAMERLRQSHGHSHAEPEEVPEEVPEEAPDEPEEQPETDPEEEVAEVVSSQNEPKETEERPWIRGARSLPEALMQGKPAEPRVTMPEGWPRPELEALGITWTRFVTVYCKQPNVENYRQMAKTGQWIQRHYRIAEAALDKLRRERAPERALEPQPARM